jgi:phage shock protein C
MNDRLYRSRDERVIGGVAGGLADYLGLDPALVRVIWVVLALASGGAFLLLYLVMLLVVPEEPLGAPSGTTAGDTTVGGPTEGGSAAAVGTTAVPAPASGATPDWRALRAEERARRREARSRARTEGGSMRNDRGGIVFGLILVVLGAWFLLKEYFPQLDLDRLWPLLLIGLGLVVLAGAIRRKPAGS